MKRIQFNSEIVSIKENETASILLFFAFLKVFNFLCYFYKGMLSK